MKKTVAIIAWCGISLLPILSTAAMATVTILDSVTPHDRSSDTDAQMQTQCDALADALPGDEVIATVENIVGPTWVSGPTNPTNRAIDEDTVVGRGTFTLGGTKTLDGDPFRIGGSVNMFALRYASEKLWTNSEYDFTADYDSVYSYSFGCKIVQTTHNPDEVVTETYPSGHYENYSEEANDEDQNSESCNGINYHNPHWGEDLNVKTHTRTDPKTGETITKTTGCRWVSEGGTFEVEISRKPVPDTVITTHPTTTTPVSQSQSDNLKAHETFGDEDALETGKFADGQAVVCISPKKLPGTWSTPNGQLPYATSKCTTAWYNSSTIVWNAAHAESSNGVTIPN